MRTSDLNMRWRGGLLSALLGGGLWLGCTDSRSAHPADAATSAPPPVVFTDVTEAAGLGAFRHDHGGFGQAWAPEIVGAGGGFLDYDGDGWLDVLLVGGGKFRERQDASVQALWLYRNNGDGTFTEQTTAAGLGNLTAYGLGLAAADYDNDGDEDFVLTTLYEDLLFRNDGGRFTEVAQAAGVGQHLEWGSSPLFFDADRDGHLDLFIGNYVDWTPQKDIYCAFEGQKVYCTPSEYEGIPSRFYRNNGDGTFTDRTAEAGFIPMPGKAFGVVELDYNHDSWSDLYIAEDTERNLLYENNHDGTFTERGVLSGVAFDQNGKARAGMGADAGVVDTTGETTLFVGNFSEETVGVYQHLGDGLFTDRVAVSRLGHPSLMTLTFGLILFDVDLDSDLDLLTANGHVQTHIERMREGVTFREPAQLFLNRGDGVFDEFRPADGPLTVPMVARGAAYADYDRDGDLDVLLTENNGPAHLWRNDVRSHNTQVPYALHLSLVGRQSNRDALGARVRLWQGGRMQERRVRTGSSYLSQSEKGVVFGLGRVSLVDSVEVVWPSGRRDVGYGLSGNGRWRWVEGNPAWEEDTVPPGAP